MGGSDPCGMIGWIATQYIPKSLQLTIIVGAIDSLKSTIKSDQIHLVSFQKSPWEHYVSGDAALVAGGSICWEMAYLGVPMVLVQTAENQSALIRCFVDNHAAHLAGPVSEIQKSNNLFTHHFCEDSLSFELRKSLSSRASEMVDGYGLERVIAFILNEPFWIRRAQLSDKQITFDLANDLETRKNSFVSKPIIWEEHEEWFSHRINKDKSPFYILVDESEQVMSVVRFDYKQDGDYVVSVNLSPDFRGRGLGTLVLTETLRQLKTDFSPKSVRAVIKNDNEASRRAFIKAGFVNKGDSKDYGIEANEYVYTYED